MTTSTPNPWPVPDAAIDAGVEAWHTSAHPLDEAVRDVILAALPLLGIAELLEEARKAVAELDQNITDEFGGKLEYSDLCSRLRDAAARMKGEA